MKAMTRIARGCLVVAATLLFWGCAGSGSGQATHLSAAGQHATGFVNTHWIDYAKDPDQCAPCHGSTTDPASTGGTSGISCFSCHGSTGATHPAGWSAGLSHGRLGAQAVAAAATANSPGTGLAACARCHGEDYRGGLAASSCFSCHATAPHPGGDWTGGSLSLPSHTFTSFTNAPACFTCHAANPQPVPAQAPGCFNNTMCHGNFG